jgi:hypothetical protein
MQEVSCALARVARAATPHDVARRTGIQVVVVYVFPTSTNASRVRSLFQCFPTIDTVFVALKDLLLKNIWNIPSIHRIGSRDSADRSLGNRRIRLFGVDAQVLDRLFHHAGLDLAVEE